MSLKKRMFHSSMTILFLSLISLLVVVFLVLVVFEDSIERKLWTMEQAKLDNRISQVASMVDEAGIQDIEKLVQDTEEIGYEAAVDVIRGLGLGADDYITKPFDPSQLVARVRSHLKRYERLTKDRRKDRENLC